MIAARLYDLAIAPIEAAWVHELRAPVVGALTGLVLDVGAGTGVNAGLFGPDARPIVLDRDDGMLRRARAKGRGARPLVRGDGMSLPFRHGTFDAVLFTLVLCSIPRPEDAVREALRVLKPGGRIAVVEHVRAPSRAVARAQGLLTPAWKHVAGGCRLDRDTEGLLGSLGLACEHRESRAGGIFVAGTWRPAA